MMTTTLIAKNKHQLDICLRLLFKKDISYVVIVRETDDAKRKIYFEIEVIGDYRLVEDLQERYQIMIS